MWRLREKISSFVVQHCAARSGKDAANALQHALFGVAALAVAGSGLLGVLRCAVEYVIILLIIGGVAGFLGWGLKYVRSPEHSHDDLYELIEGLRTQQVIPYLEGPKEITSEVGHLFDNALMAFKNGDYATAESLLNKCLNLNLGEEQKAGCFINLGVIFSLRGENEAALKCWKQVSEQNWASPEAKTVAFFNIGLTYDVPSSWSVALSSYKTALNLAKIVRNRTIEEACTANIAVTYSKMGRLDEALQYMHQAISISTENGNQKGRMILLGCMASIYNLQGKFDKARKSLRDALEIAKDVGDRDSEALSLDCMGTAHLCEGIQHMKAALQIYEELGSTEECERLRKICELLQKVH